MYCPNCGAENINGNEKCANCEYVFPAEIPAEDEVLSEVATETVEDVKAEGFSIDTPNLAANRIAAIAIWGLAVIVLILSFVAAGNVVSGGASIAEIQSVGGKTLEEAYYQELGTIYKGYAGIIRCIGLFMATVLGYFGFNCFNKEK